MHDFLFSPAFFPLALVMGIIVLIIRDRNNRKERGLLLQTIENSKVKAVYFDTKSTLKSSNALSFHIQWANAELIFTERSILCFSYISYFGYRIYTHIRHWYLRGEKIPRKISQSAPIKNLAIKGQNLVISSSLRKADVTVILKDVADSEQFETVKKMLNICFSDYQEN